MRRGLLIIVCALLPFHTLASEITEIDKERIKIIFEEGPGEVAWEFKKIYKTGGYSNKVYDVIAEVIHTPVLVTQKDQAWGCYALSSTKTSRYYNVIKQLMDKLKSEGKESAFRHCKKAIKDLKKSGVDSYVLGSIEIMELRKSYISESNSNNISQCSSNDPEAQLQLLNRMLKNGDISEEAHKKYFSEILDEI